MYELLFGARRRRRSSRTRRKRSSRRTRRRSTKMKVKKVRKETIMIFSY